MFKNENYQNCDLKRRHHFLRPLKKANFKYSEIRRMGYKVSRHLWNNCNDETPRNLGKVKNKLL
jgi:hypothetical protein